MTLRQYHISSDEKEHWRNLRERCRAWGHIAEGVVYHEELAGPNGMSFLLLPDSHHTLDDLRRAENTLRRDRDVVRMQYLPSKEIA